MTEITIEIPDSLHKILPALEKPFLLRVIRNIARTKIEEDKQQLRDAQKHIRGFEKRYKMTFETFAGKIPPDADYKAHEDYIEWSFWVDVQNKLAEEIKEFQKMNGGP
jgi:hypothetical protein